MAAAAGQCGACGAVRLPDRGEEVGAEGSGGHAVPDQAPFRAILQIHRPQQKEPG